MSHPTVLILACALLSACGTAGSPRAVTRNDAYGRALVAFAADDWDETITELADPLAREPWDVEAHLLHQDALAAAGRGDQARAYYEAQSVAAAADGARALLAARAMPREGDARLRAYRAAMVLDPDSAWVRAALASELIAAVRALDVEATEERDAGYPEDADALDADRATTLIEAVALAEGAVTAAPGLGAAHAAVSAARAAQAHADSARRGELLEAAITAQRRAAELSAGDPRPWAALAVLQRTAGDDASAADSYRLALDLDEGDPVLLAGLGRTLLDRGEADDAVAALQQASIALPDNPFLLHDLGVARQRTGDLDGAVEALRRATEMAPDDPRPLRALALVLRERSGEPEPRSE